jgi:hypothetical protein
MLSIQPKILFSAKNKPVQSQPRPDTNKISKLRDELVKQFPGGETRYSNGTGVGLISRPNGQQTGEVGIVVYHQTDSDQKILVNYLLKNKVITPRNDGVYLYKNTPVGFEVIGEIRAGG